MVLKNQLELRELENIYCSRDNYKIVDRETPKGVYAKKCYVFFSSPYPSVIFFIERGEVS